MVGVTCLSRLNVNMCEKRTAAHYGKYDRNVSKEKKKKRLHPFRSNIKDERCTPALTG